MSGSEERARALLKVVYFDEASASDYLDIAAGGKLSATSEDVKKRAAEAHAKTEARLLAKLAWLPFLGVEGEVGGGASASRSGESVISKTIANTILTDYLEEALRDERIVRLSGYTVSATANSMAYVKMYTPFMIIARTEDQGVDLARLDEALEGAKGYYELIATDDAGGKKILRFNIRAFRNSYGLADLTRMNLSYHCVQVGRAAEEDLGFPQAAGSSRAATVDALALLDGAEATSDQLLDVFDVILAGIEDGR